MKTNLIFRRSVVIEGVTKVVTRVVPVDVPTINSGEGWQLAGHADLIEFVEESTITPVVVSSANNELAKNLDIEVPTNKELSVKSLTTFESDVRGTSKLIRSRGTIKIALRSSNKNKEKINYTSRSSVCISDYDRERFFKDCKELHGASSGNYSINVLDSTYYSKWDEFITKEYATQKERVIKRGINKR